MTVLVLVGFVIYCQTHTRIHMGQRDHKHTRDGAIKLIDTGRHAVVWALG